MFITHTFLAPVSELNDLVLYGVIPDGLMQRLRAQVGTVHLVLGQALQPPGFFL